MGKRIKSQKAGKGSPTFKATHRARVDPKYRNYSEEEKKGMLKGSITGILNDLGNTATLMEASFDGKTETIIAAEGVFVGQEIKQGANADMAIGNVAPLGKLPEGCPVFNIERTPGDGGAFAKGSGLYGLIVTKDRKNVYVKLPSGSTIPLNHECRATIGCAAGGGRTEKPMVKAGANYFKMKALSRPYPSVRGVAMNPPDHPFGGSQHHPGKSKSTARTAPPGRKVGAISSKRTGRKKKN